MSFPIFILLYVIRNIFRLVEVHQNSPHISFDYGVCI